MAFKAGKGVIDLSASTSALKGTLGAVKRAMKGFAVVAAAAAAAAAAAFAAYAIVLKKALKAADVQQQAEVRLAAVIKSTGMAAGFTSKQIQQQAQDLQKLTTVGDETILGAQAIIATFKNVRGDEFVRTTKAAFDLAAVLQTDVKSAALQMAKSLNDPNKGLSQLSRSGVSFSDSQKQMVKDMVATGRVAEAQRLILSEVESQFGGTAAAAANTFGGRARQAMNEWGDVLEEVGKAVIPLLEPVLAKFRELLPIIKTALIPAIVGMTKTLIKFGGWLVKVVGGFTKFKDLIIKLGVAFGKLESLVKHVLARIASDVLTLADKVIGGFIRLFDKDFQLAPGMRNAVADFAETTGKEVKDAVSDAFKQAAKDGADATKDAYIAAADKVNAAYNVSGGGKKTKGRTAQFEGLQQMWLRINKASMKSSDPQMRTAVAVEKQTKIQEKQLTMWQRIEKDFRIPEHMRLPSPVGI